MVWSRSNSAYAPKNMIPNRIPRAARGCDQFCTVFEIDHSDVESLIVALPQILRALEDVVRLCAGWCLRKCRKNVEFHVVSAGLGAKNQGAAVGDYLVAPEYGRNRLETLPSSLRLFRAKVQFARRVHGLAIAEAGYFLGGGRPGSSIRIKPDQIAVGILGCDAAVAPQETVGLVVATGDRVDVQANVHPFPVIAADGDRGGNEMTRRCAMHPTGKAGELTWLEPIKRTDSLECFVYRGPLFPPFR